MLPTIYLVDLSTSRSSRDQLPTRVGRPLANLAHGGCASVAKIEDCSSDIWSDVVNPALAESLGPLLSYQHEQAKITMPVEIRETLQNEIAIEQIRSYLQSDDDNVS